HYPSQVGDCLNTAQSQDNPNELNPERAQVAVTRLEVSEIQIGRTKCDCGKDHDDCGHRQPDGNTAAMFGAKVVNCAEDQNNGHRGERSVLSRNPEIRNASPATQGCGHNEIRNQQERAHRSEKAALLSSGRIDTAAVRKMRADNNVVETNDCRERAYREDDRKRRETSGDKCEAEHIGFARTPVAIEQRGRPFPVDVARTMHRSGLSDDQVSHLTWRDCCALAGPDNRFVRSINGPERSLYTINLGRS